MDLQERRGVEKNLTKRQKVNRFAQTNQHGVRNYYITLNGTNYWIIWYIIGNKMRYYIEYEKSNMFFKDKYGVKINDVDIPTFEVIFKGKIGEKINKKYNE